jgi:hypothetical protein
LVVGENGEAVDKALVVVAKRLGSEPDETVLELSPQKTEHVKKVFGVSETELASVTDGKDAQNGLIDAVIERVALLATRL